MIHRLSIGIAVIVLVATTLSLGQSIGLKKSSTVHGTIVVLNSYVKEGMTPSSPARKELAIENLKKRGNPLAIVEKKTNKLYIIAPTSDDSTFAVKITPYFGVQAFIKGPVYVRNNTRVIFMEDVGKSLK